MTENSDALRKAINGLPLHEPDPRLWKAIEWDLEFENRLQEALPRLRPSKPDDEIWRWVSESLALDEPPQRKAHWRRLTLASLASLCICIMAALFVPGNTAEGQFETDTVVTQTVAEIEPPIPSSPDAAEIVAQVCTESPIACSTPEAQELKSQITSLDADLRQLNQSIVRYGNDPDLIEDQVKLENLKWKLTKDLLEVVNS